ncbi:thiamine/thiamine pyrophosphate ABC transporter permease [Vibrio sp. qd031]|uniref:thiamine/thiamine pyrophosphate ABC transporter permease n=1 Tax=Vibrio sp. qd031 TaxID=1603038 RepID=UPI000A0FD598|nr:thiamine/thiamine pyrophosphate ABC transporter permease [Vibrio sp. qd031]
MPAVESTHNGSTSWRFKPSRAGVSIAVILTLFVGGCLFSLLSFSGDSPISGLLIVINDPYYRHVTQFSFSQALLSTLLSVGLAIPLSVAMYRRQFLGKAWLTKLFSVTLVLPVLVAVFGIVAIYGNSGLLAKLAANFGGQLPYSLYGLNGIVLAHLFFNLPYATRLLLRSLESIPVAQHHLSTMLGMTPWQKFCRVEWPRLKQQLPHCAGLVFMLCFTSFATVMALGGGPKATTIELAIYQAIKFDFDLQVGAVLALWQMMLCGTLVLVIHQLTQQPPVGAVEYQPLPKVKRDSAWAKFADSIIILFAILLVIPPLFMVVISGLSGSLEATLTSPTFWTATFHSLSIASCSATIALVMAYLIVNSARQYRYQRQTLKASGLEVIGSLALVTPGLVLSTGLFLWLRTWGDAYQFAFAVVVLVNSMMALPFAIKSLSQAMDNHFSHYHALSLMLGVRNTRRCRWVDFAGLKSVFLHAFAVSFLLSLGDLSAIALFGSQDFTTLPLYLLQLLGSYQMDAAATVSLWLFMISMLLLALADQSKVNYD